MKNKEVPCANFYNFHGSAEGLCCIDDKRCDHAYMLICSEYRSKIDPTTCIQYIKVGFSDRPFCDRDNMICILALSNREKCLVYVDKTKDITVFEYHKFCMEYHIVRTTFEYDDGEAVDYVYINDREFQLGQVGDCITNYTVP